jgi:hypothetical protein
MDKNNLRLKIAQANIAENLKVFLLISLDTFNDEQVGWLMENL